jgi:hypothetical protein
MSEANADREAGLLRIHAALCDELEVEERGERAPILTALNDAYNLAASASGKAQAEWVAVSERLPGEDQPVQFHVRENDLECVGYLRDGLWSDELDRYAAGPQQYDMAHVTHWAPLLPPPSSSSTPGSSDG